MAIALDPSETSALAPGSFPSAPTTSENIVTLLGGLWLTAGLFIDGYAHANIIDTATEDFFTPWHAIFYSGFSATAGWIGFCLYRRRNPAGVLTWIPSGYEWAAVGIIVFAIGGIGDMIWHTVFGVETGIDALLSPTHLLLLFGLITILAAPMHAVIRNGGPTWMAVVSMTTLALLAAFFTTYARPFSSAWTLGIPLTDNDLYAAWTIAGIITSTAIMGVSALYLFQRFDVLPFGALTMLWAVPAIGEATSLGNTVAAAVVGGLAAGLTADVALRFIDGPRRRRIGIALSTGVMAGWAAWTVMGAIGDNGLRVETEVWTGQIMVAGFVIAALTLLALPGPHTTAARGDRSPAEN